MKNREIILESRIAELEEEIGRLRGGTVVNRVRDKNGEWWIVGENGCESITLQNDVFFIKFGECSFYLQLETLCFPIGSVERFVL